VEGHGFKSLPCFAEAPSEAEGEVEGCRTSGHSTLGGASSADLRLRRSRRGLVVRPEDWRSTRFRHYATGEDDVVEIESHWTARHRGQIGIHPAARMPGCPILNVALFATLGRESCSLCGPGTDGRPRACANLKGCL